MLFIFGTSPKVTDLGLAHQVCSFCGTHAAQRVVKQQQRFSLFFIPLFSFSTKYLTTCTACGRTARISQDEAGVLTGV